MSEPQPGGGHGAPHSVGLVPCAAVCEAQASQSLPGVRRELLGLTRVLRERGRVPGPDGVGHPGYQRPRLLRVRDIPVPVRRKLRRRGEYGQLIDRDGEGA